MIGPLGVRKEDRALNCHVLRRLYDTEKRPHDRQIDQLVYELYGLTDEEIRIVEEATK